MVPLEVKWENSLRRFFSNGVCKATVVWQLVSKNVSGHGKIHGKKGNRGIEIDHSPWLMKIGEGWEVYIKENQVPLGYQLWSD